MKEVPSFLLTVEFVQVGELAVHRKLHVCDDGVEEPPSRKLPHQVDQKLQEALAVLYADLGVFRFKRRACIEMGIEIGVMTLDGTLTYEHR